MRPHGEVRLAIELAIRERGPMAVRDIAEVAQVGYDDTRWTLKRAVQSGSLQVVGREKRDHSKRWVALYDVVDASEVPSDMSHDGGLVVLGTALSTWR
jgi:hypothetical protein